MATKDIKQREEHDRGEDHSAGTRPAPLLRELLPLLRRGRALDLACGAGRNAVFLASNGWQVTGIDCSPAALERAANLACQFSVGVHRGIPWAGKFPSKDPGLLLLQADLESFALPIGQFDLVICFNYLQRPLLTAIPSTLRSGGMLLYETYTLEQRAFREGPHNPEHLLRPGELRQAFPGLETLFYREFCTGRGVASLLARKPKQPQ